MSVENLDNHQPPTAEHPGTSSKNKKTILHNKTFLIDIVDKTVSSKVEKLINVYGGKLLQTLEKSTDYLISDKMNLEEVKHSSGSETSTCMKDVELQNVPCSKHTNSIDLINKANLFSIQILTAKKFQQLLKSLLKKNRVNKKPTDKVASVLRGKVSLKIESMDQGQCPVFEFIPKWPDLGDTLCKKKTKLPSNNSFIEDKSVDEYNSSDQYSTSEIGGMCELCDMPYMNYKEHINTKRHMKESQDENKFHELDELINERPLNVIFNQFATDKKINESQNSDFETSSVKDCIKNTIITIVNSDSDYSEQRIVPCSFGDNSPIAYKEQKSKRRCCSDTNISFVPQKRPSKYTALKTDKKEYKKIKRKRKKIKRLSSKDIYKVEVVNKRLPSSSKNSSNDDKTNLDKPPVIIRLKRIQSSKIKISTSDAESDQTSSSDDDNDYDGNKKIPPNSTSNQRYIRVVRKPSFTYSTKRTSLYKNTSNNLIFTFENPDPPRCMVNSFFNSYYPTNMCIPNTRSSVEYFKDKIVNLDESGTKCIKTLQECINVLSNIESKKVGKWFYDVPNEILDDLSFDPATLVPFTDLITKTCNTSSTDYMDSSTSSLVSSSSSNSML